MVHNLERHGLQRKGPPERLRTPDHPGFRQLMNQIPTVPTGQAGQIFGRIVLSSQVPIQQPDNPAVLPQHVPTNKITVIEAQRRRLQTGQGHHPVMGLGPHIVREKWQDIIGQHVQPGRTASERASGSQPGTQRRKFNRVNRIEKPSQHPRISRSAWMGRPHKPPGCNRNDTVVINNPSHTARHSERKLGKAINKLLDPAYLPSSELIARNPHRETSSQDDDGT